jgi:hypothetical protein
MSDYSDILSRLSAFLHDSGSLIYVSGYLDEALAQALNGLSSVSGLSSPYTIEGFQDALITTLPGDQVSALIQGAAGFCFIGRAGKRSESVNLNQQVPDNILSLARINLNEFKRLLENNRKAIIQGSSDPPYPSGDDDDHWPLDDFDGESKY